MNRQVLRHNDETQHHVQTECDHHQRRDASKTLPYRETHDDYWPDHVTTQRAKKT